MFACPYCGKEYKTLYNLKGHVKEQHSRICPVCGFEGNLISHINHKGGSSHDLLRFLLFHRKSSKGRVDLDRAIASLRA